MRRHAFRPAAPGPLEGRLAPATVSLGNPAATAAAVTQTLANHTPTTVYSSNTNSASARAASAVHTAHARAVARANASSSHSNSINWNHLGDQVKNFFGFGHHSSSSSPKTYVTAPKRSLMRN